MGVSAELEAPRPCIAFVPADELLWVVLWVAAVHEQKAFAFQWRWADGVSAYAPSSRARQGGGDRSAPRRLARGIFATCRRAGNPRTAIVSLPRPPLLASSLERTLERNRTRRKMSVITLH